MKKKFSKQQQNSIKKVLGWGASNQIEKHLIQSGVYNTNDVPFSTASVRSWLNGRNMSELVCLEILKYYKKTKAKQQRLAKTTKNTFKK